MNLKFKNLRRIGPAFEAYLDTIYGERASRLPPAQRAELEQCYYGAVHWFMQMCAAQFDPDKEPTERDLQILADIELEIQAYSAVRHASLTFNFSRARPQT